ncbi:MAG: hypothetical protein E6230_24845 [Paenibacillus dendritiformis]|uniref:MauE/DoxX family redox-associated membrane protein n=1 Tax=uncultured Paenibacillus sp. TaxID=227322 RepID=UPI0025E8604A|nr:MauE/DoxX family redox-associated membrane protein [uncultured Paenibacillus sp.]MDU5145409.1 hypothetical protein [Paenibacillus dendritiformis]
MKDKLICKGGMAVFFLIRMVLSVLFLFSAITKIVALDAFKQTLTELGFSRRGYRSLLITIVLGLEVVAAISILTDQWLLYGQIGIFVLSTGFIWATYKAISQRKRIICNCYGNLTEEQFGMNTIIKNVVIILLTVSLFFENSPSSIIQASLIDILYAACVSAGLIILYSLIIQAQRKSV